MKNYKSNGINIYTDGNITDKAVIYIHGNSLSALTFKEQFDNGLPFVAFDLPGHGLSDWSKNEEESYCMPGYVNVLKRLIEETRLNNYILVGHSLGGHIAIEAAEELKGIKGLVIFGTPPIGMPPQMDKMFLPNPKMAHAFKGDLEPSEITDLANEFVNNNPKMADALSVYIKQSCGGTRGNLGASIGKGIFKNEIAIVEKFNSPIAVFHGEKDPLVNLDYLKNISFNNFWGDKIHSIANVGHTPQLEQPSEFNRLLKEFCSSVL